MVIDTPLQLSWLLRVSFTSETVRPDQLAPCPVPGWTTPPFVRVAVPPMAKSAAVHATRPSPAQRHCAWLSKWRVLVLLNGISKPAQLNGLPSWKLSMG